MATSAGDVGLHARNHKHILADGIASTSMPIMLIPLPDPSSIIPMVTEESTHVASGHVTNRTNIR